MKDVALDPFGLTGSDSIGAASILPECTSSSNESEHDIPFVCILLLDVREFGFGRAAKSRRKLAQFDQDWWFSAILKRLNTLRLIYEVAVSPGD
jgi:hypothetical protein